MKGEKPSKEFKHALPVFGVDTTDDAFQLQVRFGRLTYDGKRFLYSRDDFNGDYEEMGSVTRTFREHYDRMQQREFLTK